MSLLPSSLWQERANCFYRDINCQSPLYLRPVKRASPQLIKHLELNAFPQITREPLHSQGSLGPEPLSSRVSWERGATVGPIFVHLFIWAFPPSYSTFRWSCSFPKATSHSKCFLLPHHSSSLFTLIKHLWVLLKSRWPFPRFPRHGQPRYRL